MEAPTIIMGAVNIGGINIGAINTTIETTASLKPRSLITIIMMTVRYGNLTISFFFHYKKAEL